MFFIDKYIPKNIKESHFHKELLNILEVMSKDESIPHLIFYGPEGSGKKTIIRLLLQMLYDDDVNNTTMNNYTVIGSGNKTNTISIKQSNYHIVIEPNNNNFDKHLITDLVKIYAKKVPLNIFKSKRSFKTVLINSIDNMSYYAQTSLRRTMEKYSKTCRFIMWCHSLSKVIDPLKSRCLCFKVPSPSESDIFTYIFKINISEKMNLNFNKLCDIAEKSNGSIKKALWILQLVKSNYDYYTEYNKSLINLVNIILKYDLSTVNEIRNILYNMMITNFEGTRIISDILMEILKRDVPESVKCNIINIAAKYDHNLIRGRREIIHLEAFIISIMNILFYHNTENDDISKKIIKKKVSVKKISNNI